MHRQSEPPPVLKGLRYACCVGVGRWGVLSLEYYRVRLAALLGRYKYDWLEAGEGWQVLVFIVHSTAASHVQGMLARPGGPLCCLSCLHASYACIFRFGVCLLQRDVIVRNA